MCSAPPRRAGLDHLVALVAQEQPQRVEDVRLIVGDQDADGAGFGHPLLTIYGCSGPGADRPHPDRDRRQSGEATAGFAVALGQQRPARCESRPRECDWASRRASDSARSRWFVERIPPVNRRLVVFLQLSRHVRELHGASHVFADRSDPAACSSPTTSPTCSRRCAGC